MSASMNVHAQWLQERVGATAWLQERVGLYCTRRSARERVSENKSDRYCAYARTARACVRARECALVRAHARMSGVRVHTLRACASDNALMAMRLGGSLGNVICLPHRRARPSCSARNSEYLRYARTFRQVACTHDVTTHARRGKHASADCARSRNCAHSHSCTLRFLGAQHPRSRAYAPAGHTLDTY
eukprot:5924811-Pleurochrysis_carterae.AAC.1